MTTILLIIEKKEDETKKELIRKINNSINASLKTLTR